MNSRVGALDLRLAHSRAVAFIELMKPELTGLSVLTSLCGFYLASTSSFSLLGFLWTGIGTLLIGGGAGALNQYAERDYDARMRRTERRPLPSGRVLPLEALSFGLLSSLVGITILTVTANVLTGLLGGLTLVTYLFLYTPLKRLTPLATWVGGIPGALPPVMGWTAVTNEISAPAIVLFAILLFWQIPHFHSLAWLYRKDYARAGFRMLTVLDERGSRTSYEIILSCAALIAASASLSLVGVVGQLYLFGALIAGILFLGSGIMFARMPQSARHQTLWRSNARARRVFSVSLLYLPSLMVIIAIDKIW